jgi:hypothetical protein
VSPCGLIIFFFAFGFEDYDPAIVLGLAICVCSLVFSFFLALAYFGAMEDGDKKRNFGKLEKQCFGLEWDEFLKLDAPYEFNKAFSFLVGPGLAITIPVLTHSALTLAELQASIPCLTSFGYCSTISCVGGGISEKGYVFLFALFILWAVLYTGVMPSFQLQHMSTGEERFQLQTRLASDGSSELVPVTGRRPSSNSLKAREGRAATATVTATATATAVSVVEDEDLPKSKDAIFPPKKFYNVMLLFRIGVTLVLITGLAPYRFRGDPQGFDTTTFSNAAHGFGVFAGIILVSAAVIMYAMQMIQLRINAGHFYGACLPHVVVVWTLILSLVLFVAFVAVKAKLQLADESEEIWANVCWLRAPAADCKMHSDFNFTEHLAFNHLDPSIKFKECEYSPISDKCFDPVCDRYKRFSLAFTLEVAGLYLACFALQGFVCLSKIDIPFLPTRESASLHKRWASDN